MNFVNNLCFGLAFSIMAASSASAAPILYHFDYTGAIETWTANSTGTYQVKAIGAQGGHGTFGNPYVGGLGAEIIGSFKITAGQTFYVAVGGLGSSYDNNYNGGGGGGSFFVDSLNNPLLIAGGGGGIRAYAGQNGFDASVAEYGVRGSGGSSTGAAILKTDGLGQGGIASSYSWGGGGAGFYSNGAVDMMGSGQSWANGLQGGSGQYVEYCSSNGGFGGGGSGTGCGGGGGGGGYSGGDGGFIAGGGGSFNAGFDTFAYASVGHGNGLIEIAQLSSSEVPEPVSIGLLGLGLVGIANARRNLARKKM